MGNEYFCSVVNDAATRQPCYRVVDNEDVVTHVPLILGNLVFVHPRITVLWIDKERALIKNPEPPLRDATSLWDFVTWYVGKVFRKLHTKLPGPLADHSPVRYCHWVAQKIQ